VLIVSIFLVLSTVFLDSFLKYLGMMRRTESSVIDYVDFVDTTEILCDAWKRVMLDCYGKSMPYINISSIVQYNILSIFGPNAHEFWDYWVREEVIDKLKNCSDVCIIYNVRKKFVTEPFASQDITRLLKKKKTISSRRSNGIL